MHRRELVFPGAEAQHADGVGAVGEHAAVLPRVLGHLTDQPVGALGRHLGGHVAVERAGGAALLHVTCRRQGLGVTGTDGGTATRPGTAAPKELPTSRRQVT